MYYYSRSIDSTLAYNCLPEWSLSSHPPLLEILVRDGSVRAVATYSPAPCLKNSQESVATTFSSTTI